MNGEKGNKSPFQNFYSGNGPATLGSNQQSWINLWSNKPRISLKDLFAAVKKQNEKENISHSPTDIQSTLIDFTDSQKFNIRRWQKVQFFKINTHNGVIACSRHIAHLRHLKKLESTMKNSTKKRHIRKLGPTKNANGEVLKQNKPLK